MCDDELQLADLHNCFQNIQHTNGAISRHNSLLVYFSVLFSNRFSEPSPILHWLNKYIAPPQNHTIHQAVAMLSWSECFPAYCFQTGLFKAGTHQADFKELALPWQRLDQIAALEHTAQTTANCKLTHN